MSENKLVGRTIEAIYLADDRKAIRFDTDQGPVVAYSDGDCCSASWIESLDMPKAIIGDTVTAVEELDLPDPDIELTHDCVVVRYGCKIITTKGSCVVEYRNESNGYYGGWLVWDKGKLYGGVYGQNVSEENWKEVT